MLLQQQEQRLVVSQRIDPKIILANTILQLNTMELLQSIENELLENPALEAVEENGCDGNCAMPSLCPYCSVRTVDENKPDPPELGDPDENYDSAPSAPSADEDYDLVGSLEAELTLPEHLCNQLRTAVSPEDYPLGEYVINSLDEKGWLGDDPEEIACDLNAPVADVMRLLKVVQSFDPPGVGAQNLQECLLLQLHYLRNDQTTNSHPHLIRTAEQMIGDYFEHFWKKRYARLARTLKCSVEEVKAASDYVSKYLNPFPASQFRPPWAYRPSSGRAAIRPDVIIRRGELGYEIEVMGSDAYTLSVNPHYREAYQRIKGSRRSHLDSERKHIADYVERAERFIFNIHLRRQTLRQITKAIVECQNGYLETGSTQFLRPLTRTRIARTLSIHESTVSRATANKFVQLPNQEVVPFDLFFDSSLSTKNAIETIIQREDASNPLSDQQIVDSLKEQGIHVARRTIVKYREQKKILSSTHRRR